MRYFIVHLHRLLDPDMGVAGAARLAVSAQVFGLRGSGVAVLEGRQQQNSGRAPSRQLGKPLKDNMFRDVETITRGGDELQANYSTGEILRRIWKEHLRPRLGVLIIASVAMLLTAATTGAIPFLIQRTADDVFVGKNAEMIYWITIGIVVVTVVKAFAEYVADVTVAFLGHRFVADLRIQMFGKLARADLKLDSERAFRQAAVRLSQ